MRLLLCAATEFEIKDTVRWIREEGVKEVEVLITGIGLTAATYSLTKAVLKDRPDFILQAGIAGSLDPALPLSKIVLVRNEVIGDLGVEEASGFHSLFDMKLLRQNEVPWHEGRLSNNLDPLSLTGLMIVDGVTVNEISTNQKRIQLYRQLGASVESMEGAALHYVALMEKIPFLQIRSLSNFAGERNKNNWVMAQAIGTLNQELQRILQKLL